MSRKKDKYSHIHEQFRVSGFYKNRYLNEKRTDYVMALSRGNFVFGYVRFHPYIKQYVFIIDNKACCVEDTLKKVVKELQWFNKDPLIFRTLRRQYYTYWRLKKKQQKKTVWTCTVELKGK